MAVNSPQDNETYNIEKSFGDEPSELEQRATALQSRRAMERRNLAKTGQQDYLRQQNLAPETQFAGMEHPEIDSMPEQPSEEGGEYDEDEEGGEEEGGEGWPAEQKGGGGKQPAAEQAQAEQAEAGQSMNAQKQIRALRNESLKLNNQISGLERNVKRQLMPIKTKLAASKLKDRTKNAVKISRACLAGGFTLWWTIILPLLALLATIAVFLLWLCGFNLGAPSVETLKLESRLKETRKKLQRERDMRARPLRVRMARINRQINTLASRGRMQAGRQRSPWGPVEQSASLSKNREQLAQDYLSKLNKRTKK